MTERHRAALAELAELGMSLARKLHAQAETVEDVEQAAELSLAFHRVSRSVRQTVALEAKLDLDAKTFAVRNTPTGVIPFPKPFQRSAQSDADAKARLDARLDARRLREHAAKMRSAVEKMVYEALDREDADFLMEDVDYQLAIMDPGIMDAPVETYLAQLRRKWDIPDAANRSSARAPEGPAHQSSG